MRGVSILITYEYKVVDIKRLLETINNMSKAKTFDDVAKVIYDFIENLIPYNMIVIYAINKEQMELEVVSCKGSDVKNLKKRVPLKIGQGAVGWVAKEKKALVIDDALNLNEIHVRQFYDEDPIIRSFLAVPLVVGDDLIGILSVSCSEPNRYKRSDAEIITAIASQVAALLKFNNEINKVNKFSDEILENINSGVIVIDQSLNIKVFNKAAEDILGYSRKEVLGKNAFEILFKEDNNQKYIIETIQKGKVFFERPGYIIRKDGRRISTRFSTSYIKDEEKNTIECICIFRDNTEVESLQQKIMQADKLAALGRLTSGITHEIRNPLLPIRTASSFLLNKLKNKGADEETIKLLTIINEESERLNKFLVQLSSLNKCEFILNSRTSLRDSIEDTIFLIKHDLVKNNITLLKDYPNKPLYVPYSKDKLKQVFLNLFLNSIDAIVSNREVQDRIISIKVEIDHTKAIIYFKDTGCGIDEKSLKNIFDPFYTTKEDGTGLGLHIVYSIITSAGGHISVESSPNKGTTFIITMPLMKTGGDS